MQGCELVFFSKFSELKKCFYAPGKQLDFEGKLDFKKLGGGGAILKKIKTPLQI